MDIDCLTDSANYITHPWDTIIVIIMTSPVPILFWYDIYTYRYTLDLCLENSVSAFNFLYAYTNMTHVIKFMDVYLALS